MPVYLIRYPGEPRDDAFIDGDDLVLTFDGPWAVFTEADGTTLAVSAAHVSSIQRVDGTQDEQPADTER